MPGLISDLDTSSVANTASDHVVVSEAAFVAAIDAYASMPSVDADSLTPAQMDAILETAQGYDASR